MAAEPTDKPANSPEKSAMMPTGDLAFYGCAMAILTGVGMGVLGIYLLATGGGPGPLRISLIALGVSNTILGYKALHGSRVAWAFATATCGTLAVISLFGAPKFRDITELSLLASTIPFNIFIVTTILLAFRQGN